MRDAKYIVDTSNWWIGHQVLIRRQWIQDERRPGATLSINSTRQAVKDAPPYDSAARLTTLKWIDAIAIQALRIIAGGTVGSQHGLKC